jgi:hypothetical protein
MSFKQRTFAFKWINPYQFALVTASLHIIQTDRLINPICELFIPIVPLTETETHTLIAQADNSKPGPHSY